MDGAIWSARLSGPARRAAPPGMPIGSDTLGPAGLRHRQCAAATSTTPRRYNAPPPKSFDFIVVASPAVYYGLLTEKWVSDHPDTLTDRPVVFCSVCGVGAGQELNG